MPVDSSGNPLPKVDQGGIPEGISPNRRTAYIQSVDDVNRKMQGGKASPFETTMRPEYDQEAQEEARRILKTAPVNPNQAQQEQMDQARKTLEKQNSLIKDQLPITDFQNDRKGFLDFYGDKLQQSASQENPEDNRDYYNTLDQYGKRYILPDEYKAEFGAMQALNQAIEAYNDVESRFADKDPKLREDVMSKAWARVEKAREGLTNSRELSYEATDKKLRDLQGKREEIENDEGSALNAVLNLIPFGSLLSGESKEEKLAAVDQEIKRLELSKRVIDLSPTGALSAVGVEVGEDEDPAEKLERYYRTMEKAYYDHRGDYEGDLEGAVKGAVGSFFGTDDSRAFADLKMELQALAPLVMLRRIPMGDDGAGEVFYKSFLNSFNPQLQAELEAESTQSSINRIEGALEMAGAKVSDPDVGQAMDKIASPYEHYSAKDWAQMMGPTTAMMAQITMSSPLYGGIMRATKLGKFLEAGKKTGTILGTEKGMTALGNTSVGRGVVKAVYGGLDEGIKFQTAGSVFGSDEELNFLSGFVGGLAAYPLSTLAEKGAEKTFRKHLSRMFGDKTEDAYRKIYDLGEAMKSGTKIAARGPAETFEEFGNEIGNIYRESSNWAEISKKFEERFGDMSENLHFAVSTAVMGWGFGAATNIGSINLAKSKKHYENLTEVEKQQFRSFMEEMNGEMEEVAEGIADTVNADEEARQNQEPAQEVEPEATESAEDTSGEQDGTEEVSEDAGQDDVEADNGRVDTEEGVAEEAAPDKSTTTNEQVDETGQIEERDNELSDETGEVETGQEQESVDERDAGVDGEVSETEEVDGEIEAEGSFAERLAENNNSQVEDIGDVAEGQKKVKILDTEITVSEDADKITLEKIRTDEEGRGKGSATEAMDALIDEADKSGKPIELTLKPEEGTDKQRLREFYEGFGFEGEGDLMTRQPVQDENQDNIQQSEEVDEPGVQLPQNVTSETEEEIERRRQVDLNPEKYGYHGGTLSGKSDYLTIGYEGDQPFTGHYFFSDRSRAEDRGDRSKASDNSVKAVDFSRYNMLRPTTNGYWALKSNLKKIKSKVQSGGNIDFEIDMLNSFVPEVGKWISSNRDNLLGLYQKWDAIRSENFATKNFEKSKTERFETFLLKEMGYEGIDVRGLKESNGEASPDTSSEGSVIFDLKEGTVVDLIDKSIEERSVVQKIAEQIEKTFAKVFGTKVNIVSAKELRDKRGKHQVMNAPVWKSNVQSGLEKLGNMQPSKPDVWIKKIAEKGGKGTAQELEWISLEDYLEEWMKESNAKSVPLDVVQQYVRDNQIEIVEVVKGRDMSSVVADIEESLNDINQRYGVNAYIEENPMDGSPYLDVEFEGDGIWQNGYVLDEFLPEDFDVAALQSELDPIHRQLEYADSGSDTKYSQYTLEGGENYREVLLTLPGEKIPEFVSDRDSSQYTAEDVTDQFQDEQNMGLVNERVYAIYREVNGEKKLVHRAIQDIEGKGPEALIEELIEDADYKEGDRLRRQRERESRQKQYRSSHWEEKNILAHVRMNDRTLPNGDKVLFVEEVQSDWAQEGKKKGFADIKQQITDADIERVQEVKDRYSYVKKSEDGESFYVIIKNGQETRIDKETEQEAKDYVERKGKPYFIAYYEGQQVGEGRTEQEAIKFGVENWNRGIKNAESQKIPDMPYKKTDQWVGMAIRRVLKMAVDQGYDRVAWVTGEQSAERYDLSKQVDKITTEKVQEAEGVYFVDIRMSQGQDINLEVENGVVREGQFQGKGLDEVVGKDLAEKILNEDSQVIQGDGLKVGGEGMKTFYNSILPKVAKKEAQRFDKGAGVEVIDIGVQDELTSFQIGMINKYLPERSIDSVNLEEFNSLMRELATREERDQYRELRKRIRPEDVGGGKQLSIPITEKMKEATREGMPLFQGNQEGEIYGLATESGDILLNEEKLNANTPVHEAGHLWNRWAKENRPELYEEGLNKVRKSNYYYNVKKNLFYQEQTKDMTPEQAEEFFLDEALARAIGDSGEKFVTEARKKGFKEWFQNLMDSIADFLGIERIPIDKIREMTLEEFADSVAASILSGEEIEGFVNGEFADQYMADKRRKFDKTMEENTTFEFVRERARKNPARYKQQSNEETIEKAIAWIEQKKSPDFAYQALLKPETWTTLGQDLAMINTATFILADTYATQFEANLESNEELAKQYLERWESLKEIMDKTSTNLGRAVNAYNIWKTMTPMGMAYMIDQKIKDINSGNLSKQDIEGLQELMDELAEVKGELDQAKKRIVEEVMKTKQVKDALEAIIKQRQSNVDADKSGEADTKRGDQKGSSTKATRGKKRNRAYKPADKVKEAKADFKKALDKFKNSKGTASASFAFLNNEQIEALGEMVVALTKQGYYRTQEIVDEILDQIDAESLGIDEKEVEAVVQGTITSNSEVRQEIDDNYDRITNTTAKKLGKPIEEIVEKHYNERDPLKRSLAEKISEELGLNADEAKLIADGIERLVQKSAQAYIDKYYKKKEKKPTKAREAALDVFVNSINNGVLDNDAYRAEFLKRFKMIPELTPEQIAQIKALTENMQNQQGQFYIEAMRDLVKYTEQFIPKKWFDSFMDGWMGILYGNMLSGPGTHVVNIYSVASQVIPDAMGDLVNVGEHINRLKKNGIKSPKDWELYSFVPDFIYRWAGAISGLLDGKYYRAFKRVWKGGSFDDKWVDDISKNNRPFNVSELERGKNRFKFGKWNPYNYIKYVNRALSGEDAFMRTSFTEAYLMEKYREILSKNLGRQATVREVKALVNFDSLRESQRMAAQRMANYEARKYFEKTGRQLESSIVKQRVQEILRNKVNKEQGLSADAAEELMDNVHDAAKYSVFTYERHGTISKIGKGLNWFLGKHRLLRLGLIRDVPFVTIVANVAETIFDGLPVWGLARAYGLPITPSGIYGKISGKPSSRIEDEVGARRQKAKAWLGTIGFGILLALCKLDDDDDPEDVPILITGSATHKGDVYAKNYTYEPYTIYIRYGEGEDRKEIALNYLNWVGVNSMLNAVGEMNDRVLMDRNLPKEERMANMESFVRAISVDQVEMILNMSFLQGALRSIEDARMFAMQFFGKESSPKESKQDESDVADYWKKRATEKYLPILTDLMPQNANLVKQVGKTWMQEGYTRRTMDEAVAYALSSVSFRGNFRVDAMGEKVFTVPTDNFIPWDQWINDKSNDERWVLLRKAGYIPHKPQNRVQTIKDKDGVTMKRKMTANEEAYYNTRAGEIFSDYLTVYIRTNPEREQDRKLDVQHLDSNKKQTSLLREEIIRLHEDARKRARKETKDLIKKGTFDKYYDQMYERLKNQ